jgi:hypothetical protein
MKTTKIFVGVNGAALGGFSSPVVAVYPVQKGGKESYMLLEGGKVGVLKGSRINGKGVPTFLLENGFELAQPGNPLAEQLADFVDTQDGQKLVSDATFKQCGEFQEKYAGKTCTLVPFDPARPVRTVDVEPARGIVTMIGDFETGFTSGAVKTAYVPGSGDLDSIALTKGWLVGPEVDATTLPRVKDDELIEHAVYTMCNSGLGTLVGEKQHLDENEHMPPNGLFYKGPLQMALPNGDYLLVGGTSDDMLAVQYLRNDAVLYQRVAHFSAPKLGALIGDIAAVLVRVAEIDAQPVKKAKKKAA